MEKTAEQKRPVRRTFLIDRHFQLKYTFIIVSVGVVVSALLGFFIYRLNLENQELLGIDSEMLSQVEHIDNLAMVYLVGFVVLMAVFLFVWGIFITHKVAGPIFVINRSLRQIAEGQLPNTRPLRKGDELKGFFDTFSDMVSTLKQHNTNEAEMLKSKAKDIRLVNNERLNEVAKSLEDLAKEKEHWAQLPPK